MTIAVFGLSNFRTRPQWPETGPGPHPGMDQRRPLPGWHIGLCKAGGSLLRKSDLLNTCALQEGLLQYSPPQSYPTNLTGFTSTANFVGL